MFVRIKCIFYHIDFFTNTQLQYRWQLHLMWIFTATYGLKASIKDNAIKA